MAKKIENCIYILTNPQYPGYVKIGYASDLKQRVSSLNTGALVEFVPYAVYETALQNADTEIHAMIKLLNPILRASKFDNGKAKGKEFFKLEPEEAYELLEHIAKVSGTLNRVYRVTSDFQPFREEEKKETKPESPPVPPPPLPVIPPELSDNKPVTIKFLYGNSDYRPFTTWADYSVQTVRKAIEEYGLQTVKSALFNPEEKRFHTKKRHTFADNREAMRDFSCKEITDGLWFLTNYSAYSHQRIVGRVVELFPKAISELIYV